MYHVEIRDLVMKTTGANHVFILSSVLRRRKLAPEIYKLPTALAKAAATNQSSQSIEKETQPAETPSRSMRMG